MTHKINHADIKQWAKNYQGELFDGILCDPPYELGFMGKSWDSSGIAFDTEMWADILKLLKPGAHLLAFSGSRTYHRMAVAIEDAGFEIRDMIEWVYGSGFPKSLNIGKALDIKIPASPNNKAVSHRDTVYLTEDGLSKWHKNKDNNDKQARLSDKRQGGFTSTSDKPVTDSAKTWNGYGTALKPAHEPCVLARKPLDGTVANNVLKHGTGGLNIDGTRVGKKDGDRTEYGVNGIKRKTGNVWGKQYGAIEFDGTQGRFPSNLILDGSPEVEAVFPQTHKSGNKTESINRRTANLSNGSSTKFSNGQLISYDDSSTSAARFFFTAKPDLYCSLCYGIMEVCENNAQNAQTTSQLGTQASNTVQDNVVVKQVQEPKDSKPNKTNNAHNAVNISVSTSQTTESIAQPNVTQYLKELTDLLVKYVGNQCQKCSTNTAQSLAAILLSGEQINTGQQTQTLLWLNELTQEQLLNILIEINNLAKSAVNQTEELNDTTQIIRNLKKLYGFVNRTISESTQARFKYQSKASKSERNAGLEGFEDIKLDIGDDRPSGSFNERFGHNEPRPTKNAHPTVKPLSLTKYLATLIKPPTGGRLLVPFSGSGSEMIGALQAGWGYVEGVELTEEYIPIAEARIKYWVSKPFEKGK